MFLWLAHFFGGADRGVHLFSAFWSHDGTIVLMDTLVVNCIDGITANAQKCKKYVEESVGVVTVLCPIIGYKKSAELGIHYEFSENDEHLIIESLEIAVKKDYDRFNCYI